MGVLDRSVKAKKYAARLVVGIGAGVYGVEQHRCAIYERSGEEKNENDFAK